MKADILFDNVRAYSVERFDVLLGQKFRVQLSGEAIGTARWFADQDDVLRIVVKDAGASAEITATETGECEIQIQDPEGAVQLRLKVLVFGKEAQGFVIPAPVVEER
jgi:hypothetical protein